MIKIGRRGSLSGTITVNGRQGHAAYPHLADNPVRGLMQLRRCADRRRPSMTGTEDFQPTNLEITSIDVGNPATNVIPAKATAAFNIRFNDTWSAETVQAEIHNRLDRASRRKNTATAATNAGRFRPCLARPAEPRFPHPRRKAGRDAEPARSRPSPAASRRFRPRAAPRMRASSRTIARSSNSALSARPCIWSTSASRLPISKR